MKPRRGLVYALLSFVLAGCYLAAFGAVLTAALILRVEHADRFWRLILGSAGLLLYAAIDEYERAREHWNAVRLPGKP